MLFCNVSKFPSLGKIIKLFPNVFIVIFFLYAFTWILEKVLLGLADITWNPLTPHINTATAWRTSTIGIILLPLVAEATHHGILLDSMEGNEHNYHME